MKTPTGSPEFRAQLDLLLQRTIDKINQDPAKAAIVLTDWVSARPAKTTNATSSTQTSSKTQFRKKAA